MKRKLGPTWTAEQTAAGERFGRAWVDFFGGPGAAPVPLGLDTDVASRAAIRAKHEAQLLGYPNVVGVIDGTRMRGGKPTNEHAIVVLVSRKVPRRNLAKASLLPSELDGVPVDVVEVGVIEALDSDLPTRVKGARRARRKTVRPG